MKDEVDEPLNDFNFVKRSHRKILVLTENSLRSLR